MCIRDRYRPILRYADESLLYTIVLGVSIGILLLMAMWVFLREGLVPRSSWLIGWLVLVALAVSYTHLDVYKRQTPPTATVAPHSDARRAPHSVAHRPMTGHLKSAAQHHCPSATG